MRHLTSPVAVRIAWAAAFAWAVASLAYPFGWDQGIFAWVGSVIVDGGLPYRDAWDIKGPLVFYGYALAQAVFGHNLWGIRIVDLAFLGIGAFAVHAIARRTLAADTAGWAALLVVFWHASGSFWHTAQPDAWAALLAAAGIALLLCGTDRAGPGRIALAGILVGCGITVKVFFAALLLPAAGALLAVGGGAGSAFRVALLGIGAMLPIAAWTAFFFARGAGAEFIDVWLTYPFSIYARRGGETPGVASATVLDVIRSMDVLLVSLPLVILGIVALWRRHRPLAWVLVLWLFVAAGCVVLQGRYFRYHWAIVHPPAALLAACGLAVLRDRAARETGRLAVGQALRAGLAVAVLAFAAIRAIVDTTAALAHALGVVDREQHLSRFPHAGAEIAAARHIRTRTAPDDKVAVWGWSTGVLYMSERRSPTRFGFAMPLVMGGESRYPEAYRREFLGALERDPPRYVVVAPLPERILGRPMGLEDFAEFRELVRSRYVVETQIGDLTLHVRRPE